MEILSQSTSWPPADTQVANCQRRRPIPMQPSQQGHPHSHLASGSQISPLWCLCPTTIRTVRWFRVETRRCSTKVFLSAGRGRPACWEYLALDLLDPGDPTVIVTCVPHEARNPERSTSSPCLQNNHRKSSSRRPSPRSSTDMRSSCSLEFMMPMTAPCITELSRE